MSGQQVRSLTLKLPQTAGIKDPTPKYQGADEALSVILAAAGPLCLCEKPPGIRLTLGSKHGSCTLAGEEFVPPSASSRWFPQVKPSLLFPNTELPPLSVPPALG